MINSQLNFAAAKTRKTGPQRAAGKPPLPVPPDTTEQKIALIRETLAQLKHDLQAGPIRLIRAMDLASGDVDETMMPYLFFSMGGHTYALNNGIHDEKEQYFYRDRPRPQQFELTRLPDTPHSRLLGVQNANITKLRALKWLLGSQMNQEFDSKAQSKTSQVLQGVKLGYVLIIAGLMDRVFNQSPLSLNFSIEPDWEPPLVSYSCELSGKKCQFERVYSTEFPDPALLQETQAVIFEILRALGASTTPEQRRALSHFSGK